MSYYYLPSGKKTTEKAHRKAWALTFGPIPPKILICHHCDNPACYRPIHLFAGSHRDNAKDCVAKGRHVCSFKLYPEIIQRGEKHHNSILNDAIIRQIRELSETMKQADIGARFGIGQTHVSQIVRRKIWGHVS